jgi:chromate reductase
LKISSSIAGSLRAGSYNRKLLNVAVGLVRDRAEVDLLDLRDVTMPIYDGDLEAGDGPPEGARRFKERIAAADALLVATPEYNHSIPGGLKNALDWASRPPGNPFRGKVALVVGCSPGGFGAVRGVQAVRQVLSTLFVMVLPQTVTIPKADQAFDEAGNLRDDHHRLSLEKACAELLRVTQALRSAT